MLLGIVLHVALAFTSIPWSVQDSQQSEFYFVLFNCIHGFRMPLFFMLSGFFTAMLWRKRGLGGLVKQRSKRILLPLIIGCFTIVPTMWGVGYFVSRPSATQTSDVEIWDAVVAGDSARAAALLKDGNVDIDAINADSGSTMLCTAAFLGHTELATMLVDAGADVNLPNRDRSTPLHIAVFMGNAAEASVLLQAGADPDATDGGGQTPKDLLKTDYGTTAFIAGSFGVQVDEETLMAGRAAIAKELGEEEYLGSKVDGGSSPNWEGLQGLLFYLPVFMHLWFLWFLCWLVVAFAVYAVVAKVVHLERLPRWLICSPISLLWLIPLTVLPQSFMQPGTFGPDSSIGLLPIPSVLGYYAVFFFFGAIYWDMDDKQGQLGRWWSISLPIALLILFPLGMDVVTGAYGIMPQFADDSTTVLVSNLLQASFAWLMTFGSIGLCRQLLSSENATLRYVSDSSYWLYLVHLPLVLLAQWLVRDLQIPAFAKFSAIILVISTFLLLTYEYGVRYTWIGKLLNGPRTRPE